jgi:hypothetical protein
VGDLALGASAVMVRHLALLRIVALDMTTTTFQLLFAGKRSA